MNKQELLICGTFRDDWMRTVIFLAVIGIAAGVIFHDYPGHDHLNFLHNLLREDAPTIEHEPIVLLSWLIVDEDSARPGVNVNYVSSIWLPKDNLKPVTGLNPLYSGVSPPDEYDRLVNGFDELVAGLSPPAATSNRSISLKFYSSLIALIPIFSVICPDIHLLHLVIRRQISQLQINFPAISRAFMIGQYKYVAFGVSALC